MQVKVKNKKIRNDKDVIPNYKYIMCVIIAGGIMICPFVAHLKIYKLSSSGQRIFEQTEGLGIDFFLYYKAIFLIVLSFFIILFFIGEHIFPDKKIPAYQLKSGKMRMVRYCCGGYLLCCIVSFIVSKYKWEGIWGLPTEFEGILVLISYMVIMLSAIQYFGSERALKIFKILLLFFSAIWITLSIIELTYRPIFEIEMFQKMLAPEQYEKALATLSNEEYRGMLALAMYNPNYYGGMCVLVFPFLFSFYLFEVSGKKWGYLILSIGMLVCTIGSKSTGPIYCVIFEVILLVVLIGRSRKNSMKNVLTFFMGLILTILCISITSNGKFLNTLTQTLTNTREKENKNEKFVLKDLEMNGNQIFVVGENETLQIVVDLEQALTSENIMFLDSESRAIEQINSGDLIRLEDDRYKNITISIQEFMIRIDLGYDAALRFYVTTDGFKGVGPNGTVLEQVSYECKYLGRYDSLATGRGYTWIRTLPMLKYRMLIGTGPGSFPYYFPQFDYVGLLNTHGSAEFLIDKPHNMYLQVAVNTGMISLICLLILFAWIIWQNFLLSRKGRISEKGKSVKELCIGSVIAIVGWLICGMVNDSIVTVSPMFWFIVGINIAIIIMISREYEKE